MTFKGAVTYDLLCSIVGKLTVLKVYDRKREIVLFKSPRNCKRRN